MKDFSPSPLPPRAWRVRWRIPSAASCGGASFRSRKPLIYRSPGPARGDCWTAGRYRASAKASRQCRARRGSSLALRPGASLPIA